jgi:hypothetical protein
MTTESDSDTGASQGHADIDRLVQSFFALFSNRGGVLPDLSRVRDLFLAQGVIAKWHEGTLEVMTLDEFIAPRQELLTSGRLTEFFEVELSATTRVVGQIAQRLSVYEKSGVLEGAPFVTRGAKSFQFIDTKDGWRILSLSWDDEREGFSVSEVAGT